LDKAARQRALLHILRGEFDVAATLLAEAPGLGWSDDEHPGHLVFPIFVELLGGDRSAIPATPDYDERFSLLNNSSPKLHAPTLDDLLQLADLSLSQSDAARASMVASLRSAAEARVDGVAEHKRRRQYGHAASLAVQCAKADGSKEARAWLDALMDKYRRFSALKREFKAAGA